MWVLRDNRQRRSGKARVGLYRVSRDGYERYDSASGYYLGELTSVVQDPSDPGRLWLLQKHDNALIDFDKRSKESELIGINSRQRKSNGLLTSALAIPQLKSLTTRRHETLDPDAPELTWGVQGSGVYLTRGPTVLHRWPAKLPIGPIEIIRDEQTTVWIATSEGLLEFPIAESLAELRQPGPTEGPTEGRRPR
jgi:hypothetical protein